MSRKTNRIQLIVLLGVIASFLSNPTHAQAQSAQQEQQLSIMLASAVEFRWDSKKNASQPHESLGTKISANTILTHNHFSDLAGTYILDPSNPKRPHGVSSQTRTTQFGAQTRLVYSSVRYAGTVAPIATLTTIRQLQIGDTVDVVYWDDAQKALTVDTFQIKAIRYDAVIVLDDPNDIINSGDSGGGVFYDGELIGNTWRYLEFRDRSGHWLDKEVHVQIVPPEVRRALSDW